MKLPIEVHNPLIPFKGFSWVTWLAFAFTRKPNDRHMDEETRRHEGVHCCQQIELAVLFAAIILPVAISYSFAWWGLGADSGRHSIRRLDLLRHFVARRGDYPALSGRILLHVLRNRGIQP